MGAESTPLKVSVSSDRPLWMFVEGELDAAGAPTVRRVFDSLPRGPRTIDLARVSLIGAAGLGLLVELAAVARSAGDAMRIVPSDVVVRLTTLAGLDDSLSLG